METYRGRNLKDIIERACKFFDHVGSVSDMYTHHWAEPKRRYTLNSLASHIWQPKCTWYYGVL